MSRIVAVVAGDTGEQVLVAFARKQIAVVQRGAAEIGQQRITRAVHTHLVSAAHLHCIVQQADLSEVTIRHAVHPALSPLCVKFLTTICGLDATGFYQMLGFVWFGAEGRKAFFFAKKKQKTFAPSLFKDFSAS